MIAVQRMALEDLSRLLGEEAAHLAEPAGHSQLALSVSALRVPAHVGTGLTAIEKIQRVVHSYQPAVLQRKGALRAFSQHQPPTVQRCSVSAHACVPPSVPRGAGGCPSRSAAQASTASQRVYSSGVAAASPGAMRSAPWSCAAWRPIRADSVGVK